MAFGHVRTWGAVRVRDHQRLSRWYGWALILLALIAHSAEAEDVWRAGNASDPLWWGGSPIEAYNNRAADVGWPIFNPSCTEITSVQQWDRVYVKGYSYADCSYAMEHLVVVFHPTEDCPMYEDGTYECPPPPVECASQGRKMKQYFPDGPAPPATFFDANGCEYGAPAGTPEYGTHYECGYDLANSFYCNMFYEPTGNNGTPTAFEPNDEPIDDGEQPPLDGEYYDDPPPETTTENDPPLIEPDTPAPGDTTTTTRTTKTENDPGVEEVTSSSTEVTFEQEGDTIKTTTTTTTTTTHADGTTTTTTQTDVTTTKADSSTITFDGNEYTNTSTPGYSSSGSQTTTTSTNPDGSSTTTSGGGTGDLDGDGEDDNGKGAGFGGSGPGEGLYEKTDKTFGSVLTGFRDAVMAAPIVSAMEGFFDVNVGGSCSYPTIPATDFNEAIPLTFFCGELATLMLSIVSGVLLVAGSWYAWHVAVGS